MIIEKALLLAIIFLFLSIIWLPAITCDEKNILPIDYDIYDFSGNNGKKGLDISLSSNPIEFNSDGFLTVYNVNAAGQNSSVCAINITNNFSQAIVLQIRINETIGNNIHLKWNNSFSPPSFYPRSEGFINSTKIFADEADGFSKYLGGSGVSWDIIHNANTGNQWSNTSAWYDKGIYGLYAPRIDSFVISRAYFPFNTSILPNKITIKSASILLTGRDYASANTSVCIVNWTGGQNGVYIDDFSEIGNDLLSSNVTWNVTQYNNLTLNKLGITMINLTGYSYFCAREYNHDFLDVEPTEDLRNGICFRERQDSYDEDPYIFIKYSNESNYSCDNEVKTNYTTVKTNLTSGESYHLYLWSDFDNSSEINFINRTLNISANIQSTFNTTYSKVDLQFSPWKNFAPEISPSGNETPKKQSTQISLNPTCTVWVEDDDGNSVECDFYNSTDGISWTHQKHYSSVQNTSIKWNYTQANNYASTYYWKVTANDTFANVSDILYFTTLSNPQQPSFFSACPHNLSAIDIFWTCGNRSDRIIIVRNETGYASFPSNPSNGTVFDVDCTSIQPFQDNGLSGNVTYYYSAWGFNDTTEEYSDIYMSDSATVEIISVNQSTFDRGFPIRHAIDGDWAGAQNFTPFSSVITGVDVYLRKFGTPEFNLTVELRTGDPEGALLDTVVFTPDEVASSWTWLNVDFDDITVTPDTDYFIVVPPAPSGVTTSFGYEWGYAFGNQYDDGSFWFTRDGGGLWRDLPTMYEFTFKTYGYS